MSKVLWESISENAAKINKDGSRCDGGFLSSLMHFFFLFLCFCFFKFPQLHTAAAEMELEKFELQKKHSDNIQELLEDTNLRVAKMEAEYSSRSQATVSSGAGIAVTQVHTLSANCRNRIELNKGAASPAGVRKQLYCL